MELIRNKPNTEATEEEEAARAALEGGWLTRAAIMARALRALMKDPDDTAQVFLIGLTINVQHFPQFVARWMSDEDGARLLREQPSIDSSHIDYDALRALPADTLGGAYVRFLDENGLDPDLFQAPPGLPSMIAYIAQRVRQSHDIWHVVTGYGPDIAGEVALQAFTYQVTRMPGSRILAWSGALRTLLRREHKGILREVARGAARGRKAAFLPTVVWEDHFDRPLEDVRQDLGIAA